MGTLDKEQARELALFIENDSLLYRQMTTPIIDNYARKKLKGLYNKSSAIKGILFLVEAGRKKYIKDFGSLGSPVSMETKLYVANELYDHIDEASSYKAKEIKLRLMAGKKLKTIRKNK